MKLLKSLMVAFGLMGGMAYAQTCDELAAATTDPNKPAHIKGVKHNDINAPLAIGACSTELAKDPNNARLQFQLARAYHKAEQYNQALEWHTKAANQNNAEAQTLLGAMYFDGKGVTKNLQIAKEWFGKACDNGYKDACPLR